MTTHQLAKELENAVDTAPRGATSLAYILFGIKYAHEMNVHRISSAEILRLTDFSPTYVVAIGNGRNLAPYVHLKEAELWF